MKGVWAAIYWTVALAWLLIAAASSS